MTKKSLIVCALVSLSAVGLKAAESDWAPPVSTPTASNQPLTLKDSFGLASAKSEDLRIQQENINQSNAQARAALGAALPNLSWQLTDTIQDTSGVSQESGVGGTLTRRERAQSQFVLVQPIFSGFREFSATKGFEYESVRNKLTLQRSSLTLFEQVASAFYTVIDAEARVNNTRSTLKLAQDRGVDLRRRAHLGKSRESEVLSADSQVATLQALETQNLRDLSVAMDQLSFLVGEDISGRALVDELSIDSQVPSLDEVLKQGERRSDLQAQENDVLAKRLNVRYQAGYYWPRADATADYYTKRIGFQEGIDWDVLLALDVPIYQGGTVKANVKLASSQWRQSQLTLDLLRRQVNTEIKQARTQVLASIDEIKSRENAYQTAKRSYDIQVREYRLGLVNNLDVIQALDTLQQSKTTLDDSVYQGKLNVLKLRVATEQNP